MSYIELQEGTIVNGAKLLQFLGSGKSGTVWSALTAAGAIVTLKIYAETEESEGRATHEYSMASRFDSEHILHPLSISSYDHHPVICYPYCCGRSVDGIAAHFSEQMLWQLIADIGNALEVIHADGFGHFDIKPSNILWDGQRFLLSDFGACRKNGETKAGDTAVDASSYQFDAPELNSHRSDKSDIWSLGAAVFYLYMGCNVFNGLGGRAQHATSPIPYMRKTLPALSQLIQNCLDYNPEKRPNAKEIVLIAESELSRIKDRPLERRLKHSERGCRMLEESRFWPDLMIEAK